MRSTLRKSPRSTSAWRKCADAFVLEPWSLADYCIASFPQLASGFPDPAAADSDMQAKVCCTSKYTLCGSLLDLLTGASNPLPSQEIQVASARQNLEVLKEQLAAKQRQEEEDVRRRAEEQRLLDEARRQKEREDEAAREETGRDMDIEEHAAGLDEFFLFERVESGETPAHPRSKRGFLTSLVLLPFQNLRTPTPCGSAACRCSLAA